MSYRTNDPITSKQAYAQINASGKTQAHRIIIAKYIKNHPKQTAVEIGEGTGLGQVPVSRRLSEIKNIESKGIRRFSVCGTNQQVWVMK